MRGVLSLLFLLCACSDSGDVLEQLPNSSIAGAPRDDMSEIRIEAKIKRPVTIGEDGSRFDACGGLGRAARDLAVRAAPFADAEEVGQMAQGARAHVCTRSLDQKWLGVVVPPADEGELPVDCGVSTPVERKRGYDGPCLSGWVSSASIQLVAG